MAKTKERTDKRASGKHPGGRARERGDRNAASPPADPEHLVELYRRMVLVRTFEEACQRSFRKGKIGGYLHLYTGEEAVAAGFLSAFRPGDQVITAYRDHAHALLLGCEPGAVMAELYGRRDGLVRGKGGSMHLFAVDRGLWGGHGIVGAHIPLGVGFAYALRYRGTDHICQLYLGDGAMQNGAFHEAANLAALWGADGRCPVVFIVENNQYAMGTSVSRETAMTDLAAKFGAYGIDHEKVDGMDLEAVLGCAERVTGQVRESGKPYAVEAMTYRIAPHGAADHYEKYRTKEEVDSWRDRDPLVLLEHRLREAGAVDDGAVDEITGNARDEAAAAVEFADASEPPPIEDLYADVYAGADEYLGKPAEPTDEEVR
jgi:pyruvate dehydrogenase E1 component alpha subunit